MNHKIKEYKTSKGKKRFKFAVYAGKNELSGQSNQVRKSGFKTYKEAEKAYDLVVKQIKDGTLNAESNKRLKVNDLYKMWLPLYEQDVRESTAINAEMYFKNILKSLGNVYLDKLTPLVCQKVVNQWYKKTHYSTFNYLCIYSTKLLEYAVKIDLISANPMKKIIKPKKKTVAPKKLKFYTINELKQFLATAKKISFKKFVLFRLLSYSGMRVGEALALNWSDIDFNNNTVSISKTVATSRHTFSINKPKTQAGNRVISLDDETINYLAEWRKRQQKDLTILNLNAFDDHNLLFANRDNGLLGHSSVRYWARDIAKKAGLKYITVHGFRHTHASILFKSGASMKEIQTRLGHSSIKMTMDIYTHLTSEQEANTVNKFIDAMNG